MIINNTQFNCELDDILTELQTQLRLNNIPLIQKKKDSPGDIMIQCPYHGDGQERRPSAGIRKSDGQFHCFACGETHSLEEVISHCFGYDDPFGKWGWKWLNKNFATIQIEERKDVEIHLERNNFSTKDYILDSSDNPKSNLVSEEELDKYRYTHPYWKKRGIIDENLIELFDLGYDKETDCITMPVRDINGNCLFVARRSVKTKYFNYPQGVEKPLYGLYELWQQAITAVQYEDGKVKQKYYSRMFFPEEVIVCESMIDALTAWQFGKYAVALNGLGTELQFKQLRELDCRKLILATDNDEAGLKARDRIRRNVKNKIITEYQFPEGYKDLNDLKDIGLDTLTEVF